MGDYTGTTIGLIKGDTRSLDYGSYGHDFPEPVEPTFALGRHITKHYCSLLATGRAYFRWTPPPSNSDYKG